ncbi:MAG: PilZ domain-containing protein [Planctomycetota bacterium]
MEGTPERRREQRLRYHWPVWFAEDFSGILSQGQMVDVSSGGAAFTCYEDNSCPWLGQHITARFSVPQYQQDDSFDIADFIRAGHVCRVDGLNAGLRRVAVRFFEPLPFRPGEQMNMQLDYEPLAEPAMV